MENIRQIGWNGPDRRQRGRGLLLLDDRRSFYRGPIPGAHGRSLGGFVIYAALDGELSVEVEGGAVEVGTMAVIAPHLAHSIASGRGYVAQVLLEAEDVSPAELPDWVTRRSGAFSDAALTAQWRSAGASWSRGDAAVPTESFDALFFGASLPRRRLDERVARTVRAIFEEPGERHSAEDCAERVGLSQSRFLHLFTQEVGVPFRRYRAWKRARGLLNILGRECNLTELALDCGYADSAHFSNSIREIYGIKPKEVVATGRQVTARPPVRQLFQAA